MLFHILLWGTLSWNQKPAICLSSLTSELLGSIYLGPLDGSYRQTQLLLEIAFYCYDKQNGQKPLGEERDGNQGRNPESKAEADSGSMLLTGLLLVDSYNLPTWDTTQSGLGFPTSIIIPENAPRDLLTDQTDGSILPNKVPFSCIALACKKLTKTNLRNTTMLDPLHRSWEVTLWVHVCRTCSYHRVISSTTVPPEEVL